MVYAPVSTQNAWRSYTGDKSASNHFTVRFASSALPGEYGWQLGPDGSPSNDEVMLTMPGWNNNVPGYTPVSRQNGLYYIEKTWRRVLDRPTPPESVVINSFNEFAEETSVQIADTSGLVAPAEKWTNTDGVIDNSMYWNMTKDFVRQLKHPDAVHHAKSDFASTQGAGGWSYEQWTYPSGSRVITPMTWDAANTRWKGTATWTMVRSDAQHPDVGADAARVYVAPTAGSTVVTGVVSKPQAGGDGVVVRILKNNTQIWPTGTTGTTLTTGRGAHVPGAGDGRGRRPSGVRHPGALHRGVRHDGVGRDGHLPVGDEAGTLLGRGGCPLRGAVCYLRGGSAAATVRESSRRCARPRRG